MPKITILMLISICPSNEKLVILHHKTETKNNNNK